MNFRVPKQLKANFERACEANYTNQTEVLRRAMLDYMRENQREENEVKMTYEQMVSEARKRALQSGTFTDDSEEKADDVYLVKDIDLVVKAFLKDIEAGDTAEYSEPAEFLDKHGIEWE
jgi:metal-responsive CopG/Arc/MetJ family transcriptional regulator